MDNIRVNEDFQDRRKKSFIRVGQSYIDIKRCIGLSFYKDPYGYAGVQFVFESGKAMNAPLKDRGEFSRFLLQLERFIDDDIAMESMNDIIDAVESSKYEYPSDYTDYLKYLRDSSTGNADKSPECEY